MLPKKGLKVPNTEDRRETTVTISDSNGEAVSKESETVKVVSLGIAGISELTRLKNRSSGLGYLNCTCKSITQSASADCTG